MTRNQLIDYLFNHWAIRSFVSAGPREAILVVGYSGVMARINTEDERMTMGEAERAAEGETNV